MLAREFKTDVLPISNKLLRFALQILQHEEEAKDLLQDVFLKLWQMYLPDEDCSDNNLLEMRIR